MPSTTITGTDSASRQLRREYDAARAAEGKVIWDSPDILPRDAWLRRTWQECAWSDPAGTPVLLTRWQELTLWEQAIESVTRNILLNSHATAGAALEAWKLLHDWEAPHDFSGFEFSEDSAAFSGWLERIRKQLADRGWITMAELARALRKRVASGAIHVGSPVTLAGFDEIAPADRRLFDAIGARESSVPSIPSQALSVACHDSTDELTRAAIWTRRKLEVFPGTRIGIVVPGLRQVAAIAERIFDDILHPAWDLNSNPQVFHVSAGVSLAETPMIATALLTLRLTHGLPRDEAAMIWRSPFLGMDPNEGAKLDVELRRRKIEEAHVQLPEVYRRLPGLTEGAAILPKRARPSQWSATFSQLLHLAGWPGRRSLSSTEAQTVESWKDLLSEFARLDFVLDSTSCREAVSRLHRMALSSRGVGNEESATVRILDIAETPGLRFDALWIAGLHAGAWPQRAKPNPFLPVGLQRIAGMPGCSPDREFRFAMRMMEGLLASAPEVVCSFPSHAADEEQQASPFLASMQPMPNLAPADTVARRAFSAASMLDPRPADEGLALPEGTSQRGGVHVLANQAACPFRAFAVHRLGAREMDEPDVGLSPSERGSLVHKVLELLWNNLQTQKRLNALSPEVLESQIGSCVNLAVEEYAEKQEASAALEQFCQLEKARLQALTRRWMDKERERRDFEVIQSESKHSVTLSGLKLDLRVDRMDRFVDGTHAIVDYKTSKKLSTSMWSGERPEAPQLPLYAATSEAPISEVAFAQLAAGSVGWVNLDGADLDEQRPHWRAVVQKLAADFLQGRADVDPREKPSPCDLCKLGTLCRVREMRIPPAGDEHDE